MMTTKEVLLRKTKEVLLIKANQDAVHGLKEGLLKIKKKQKKNLYKDKAANHGQGDFGQVLRKASNCFFEKRW